MTTSGLLLSHGLIHPSPAARRNLARAIRAESNGRVALSRRSPRERGVHELVPAFGLVVLHFHRTFLSDRLIANLRAFAHAGGAILAVHSAIASAKKQPSYAELLGASFAGHERPGPIELSGPAVGPDDEEPRSPSEFRLRDELYRIRPVADIEARAYAEPVREKPVQDPPEARANDAEIIAYRRELGRGRIAVCTLGHFAAVYPSVAFRCVLADALSYLIGDAQLGDAQP